MDSLEDIALKQLINNYPLDIVEKLIKHGLERVRKENPRHIVIKYNIPHLTGDDTEQLKHFLNFLIDMKILDATSLYDKYLIDIIDNLIHKRRQTSWDDFNEYETYLKWKSSLSSIVTICYQSKKILSLLSEHADKDYEKYFIIEACYKNDYLIIHLDQNDSFKYSILKSISGLKINNNEKYIVYQID